MKLTDFSELYLPQINSFLKEQLECTINDHKFSEIMSYSVLAGGKRLRPLLFLATLEILSHPISEKEIKIACGIELIHTYSLIHDDLPAMDNDDYRRGKLTSHKKFGEAEAILAGDALLPLGIQWIAEASNSYELIKVITRAIGPNGMAGGQYMDIDSTNNLSYKRNETFIDKMEFLKTGCLIVASVQMAAKYANSSDKVQMNLLHFAEAFGRAYQIYDDIVDIMQTSVQAGKKTHKDADNGKNNTLTMLGLEKSQAELSDLIARGKVAIKDIDNQLLSDFFDLYRKAL